MKKFTLFNRHPAGPPMTNVAFSGRGFIPPLLADNTGITHAMASTTLEKRQVPGRFGMMPIPGRSLNPAQRGQKQDGGAAGAGSFAARNAFNAKG